MRVLVNRSSYVPHNHVHEHNAPRVAPSLFATTDTHERRREANVLVRLFQQGAQACCRATTARDISLDAPAHVPGCALFPARVALRHQARVVPPDATASGETGAHLPLADTPAIVVPRSRSPPRGASRQLRRATRRVGRRRRRRRRRRAFRRRLCHVRRVV